ncbi:MAG: HlyC/CorC family transporter [Candidatus Sericytochromatia bacterium]|nr:HlyC/CorC family transporter [Candidatus Sericytochromatia bacterium]
MVIPLLVIALLIVINAFYVAAEFASVSVRRTRIQQLAEAGNPTAARLLPILQDGRRLDEYLAVCQIGITLASLILGAFGEVTVGAALGERLQAWAGLTHATAHSIGAVVVLVILTALQVVLGELVPKTVAMQLPVETALITLRPMLWSATLLSWFNAMLNGSGMVILKLLGIPNSGHRHVHSVDEIDMLIVESSDGGKLESDERHRLHRALRLGNLTARQLMVPRTRIQAIAADTPWDEAVAQVIASPYTRLPVYRDTIDNVVGLIHTKDMALAVVSGRVPTTLTAIMRPLTFVPQGVPGDDLLTTLRRHRSQQVIVADEYGGVAGLVAFQDVIGELLGEMADEFKADQAQVERLADGRIRLPGLLRLDDVEPWIGTVWTGEAITVGGHVVQVLGHIPVPGEQLEIDGVAVEVEAVANNAVVSLLIVPAPPLEDDDD